MPELLYCLPASTPEHCKKDAPKTPLQGLHDMTSTNEGAEPCTPRCSEDISSPELVEELVRAPSKNFDSNEKTIKSKKLSRRQLRFEDGTSLKAIVKRNARDENKENEAIFESNPFCEHKEQNFVHIHASGKQDRKRRGGKRKECKQEISNQTPQKESMPLVYGNNVSLESPDPMSKYNSSNQLKDKTDTGQSRISALLQNCRQEISTTLDNDLTNKNSKDNNDEENLSIPSPDAVTDDIYEFEVKNFVMKTGSIDCKYPMVSDDLKNESSSNTIPHHENRESKKATGTKQQQNDKFIEKSHYPGRSLSPSLNAIERQLLDSEKGTPSRSLPVSRSLDSLNTSDCTSIGVLNPTPPSRQGLKHSFSRKSPQPPSTASPKAGGADNKENLEANIRQARSRRYTNKNSQSQDAVKDISSSALPKRPVSNPVNRRGGFAPIATESFESSSDDDEVPATSIDIQYAVKSNNETHSRRPRERVVTVSGFSKELMASLIMAATKKRKRKSKHVSLFFARMESIPEDNAVDLDFPKWIKPVPLPQSRQQPKENHEQQATEEYIVWLKNQIVIANEEEISEDSADIKKLMWAIKTQNNESFRELLNSGKNLLYARDSNGNTALIVATMYGWKRGIKNLIKRGAELNAQNRFGNTPLHFASAAEEYKDIKRYLLRKEASGLIRNERGVCSCDFM